MIQNKRYKPFYKQFLRLRKNIQNRPKIFKFKKQKWVKFQQYSRRQLHFLRRFKIKDQFQFSVSKFAGRGNSLQKKFRNSLYERKAFSLFYGTLKKKYLKKYMLRAVNSRRSSKKITDFRYETLKFFESRLDTTLYRSNFSLSMESAAQLILHGHVMVNGNRVRTKSYVLKNHDLIEIGYDKKSRDLVRNSLDRSNFWPLPPKYLFINYRTLQILFAYSDTSNLMPIFNHYLNVDSVVTNIRKY